MKESKNFNFDCTFSFLSLKFSNRLLKCALNELFSSAFGDWRFKWNSNFERDPNHNAISFLVKILIFVDMHRAQCTSFIIKQWPESMKAKVFLCAVWRWNHLGNYFIKLTCFSFWNWIHFFKFVHLKPELFDHMTAGQCKLTFNFIGSFHVQKILFLAFLFNLIRFRAEIWSIQKKKIE